MVAIFTNLSAVNVDQSDAFPASRKRGRQRAAPERSTKERPTLLNAQHTLLAIRSQLKKGLPPEQAQDRINELSRMLQLFTQRGAKSPKKARGKAVVRRMQKCLKDLEATQQSAETPSEDRPEKEEN